jgi:hypothetical protein
MVSRTVYPQLTDEAVHAVARLFGVDAAVEPYTPDGTPVYRLTLGGRADGVKLVLWPSLGRVDVSSVGDHAWVMKSVGEVEVIDGVEVVFRPATFPGFLFVSVNGWVNMVVG